MMGGNSGWQLVAMTNVRNTDDWHPAQSKPVYNVPNTQRPGLVMPTRLSTESSAVALDNRSRLGPAH